MRLLQIIENYCLNSYSVEKAMSNINLSVLQELWILPVLCIYMTAINQRKISGEMK